MELSTDAPMNPNTNREKHSNYVSNVRCILVVLSLCASGRTVIVLDTGYGK